MSEAIKKLHDYLAASPSMVYPEDVLAYLPAIEDENAKLRLLVEGMATYERMDTDADPFRALEIKEAIGQLASELGIEV